MSDIEYSVITSDVIKSFDCTVFICGFLEDKLILFIFLGRIIGREVKSSSFIGNSVLKYM